MLLFPRNFTFACIKIRKNKRNSAIREEYEKKMWVGDLPICKIAHSLLEVRAALAGSCFLERCRRLRRARDNLLGSKVFDDISEGIDIGDAAAEGVDSRGGGVAAAHHIAAETIVVMGNA